MAVEALYGRRVMAVQHILTFAQTLGGGGVERAMLRLARGWLKAGVRVTLVAGLPEGPLAAEIPDGLGTIVLGRGGYPAMAAVPGIVRHARPDVIFCPGSHYTLVAAWTRMRLGRACPPIVGKVSNAPDRADFDGWVEMGHRRWLALHERFLDHLVAMTPATAAAAAAAMRMEGRVSVIPNPPALPIPGAAVPPLPDAPFVLGVGRLRQQKRWDRLIAATAALPGVPLVILGEGPERQAMEAQARALGIADRVYLPGHVTDPFPALERARVVALTSDYEGVPGVLREALSVGTPVVATASSAAVPEIVTAPALGRIVARDDGAALVAALRTVMAAPRPQPVPQPGSDSAARYLDLFDRLLGEPR